MRRTKRDMHLDDKVLYADTSCRQCCNMPPLVLRSGRSTNNDSEKRAIRELCTDAEQILWEVSWSTLVAEMRQVFDSVLLSEKHIYEGLLTCISQRKPWAVHVLARSFRSNSSLFKPWHRNFSATPKHMPCISSERKDSARSTSLDEVPETFL